MKKIEVLEKVFEKALKNGYEWGIFDYDDYKELTDVEKVAIFRVLLEEDTYYTIVFDHSFAKALWGEEKYMAYYVGFEEWADATEYDEDEADARGFDHVAHDRMPLWEYHLMRLARSTDRLKYLEENS